MFNNMVEHSPLDGVFHALADPTRRAMLRSLAGGERNIGQLAQPFAMSFAAASKHVKVLEGAGLVTTRRRGREKLHFLNPVPIREVHDRWVSKYQEPWAAALTGLKRDLEEEER